MYSLRVIFEDLCQEQDPDLIRVLWAKRYLQDLSYVGMPQPQPEQARLGQPKRYAILSLPTRMVGGPYPALPASLLDGTQSPSIPRALEPGHAWLVFDLRTAEVAHVSYLGEGLEPYCEFESVSYEEATLWLSVFPFLRETLYQQIRDPDTAFQFAKEDRRLVPRFLPLVLGSGNEGETDTSEQAYQWAKTFRQNLPALRKLIRVPSYAFLWAREFPEDRKHMRKFIRHPEWVSRWLGQFPEDRKDLQVYLNTLPDGGEDLVEYRPRRRHDSVTAKSRAEYERKARHRPTHWLD